MDGEYNQTIMQWTNFLEQDENELTYRVAEINDCEIL